MNAPRLLEMLLVMLRVLPSEFDFHCFHNQSENGTRKELLPIAGRGQVLVRKVLHRQVLQQWHRLQGPLWQAMPW